MKAKKLMCMLLAATMVCSSPLSVLAGSGVEIQNTAGIAGLSDGQMEILMFSCTAILCST